MSGQKKTGNKIPRMMEHHKIFNLPKSNGMLQTPSFCKNVVMIFILASSPFGHTVNNLECILIKIHVKIIPCTNYVNLLQGIIVIKDSKVINYKKIPHTGDTESLDRCG